MDYSKTIRDVFGNILIKDINAKWILFKLSKETVNMAEKKYKDILEGFTHLDRDTNGPNKYVVRSIKGLIESNEILDGSITRLQEIIKDFNVKSDKQTDKMIILTKVIAGLTGLMLIGLIIQIVLVQGGKT